MNIMFYSSRCLSICKAKGQLPPLPLLHVPKTILTLLLMASLFSCHRPLQPWDPDPRFDRMWRTPRDTFNTWVEATRDGDAEKLKKCYWRGLTKDELTAWLNVNLHPESKKLLNGATWIGMKAKSGVEINFKIRTSDGCLLRGVMVRTAEGWKIQSW